MTSKTKDDKSAAQAYAEAKAAGQVPVAKKVPVGPTYAEARAERLADAKKRAAKASKALIGDEGKAFESGEKLTKGQLTRLGKVSVKGR